MLTPDRNKDSPYDPFNDENYNLLFNEAYIQLCRYCMKFVNDSTVAEDIVQEQFIYVWENRKKLKHSSSLKAYLFKAVKNRSINFLRKQFPRLSDQRLENNADSDIENNLPSPQEILENKELTAILEKGLESLPPKCRVIFNMKRFAGKTNREISEDLQISIKTVEAQMTIAIKKLSAFVSNNWTLFSLIFMFYWLTIS